MFLNCKKETENELCAEIEQKFIDFSLGTETRTKLTKQDFYELFDKFNPNTFYSEDLCAKYFTYRTDKPHFVLFDDEQSIQKKVDTLKSINISHFVT